MVLLFYTTYISVDIAHHEIFHAKDGKCGIKKVYCNRIKCTKYETFENCNIIIFVNIVWPWHYFNLTTV